MITRRTDPWARTSAHPAVITLLALSPAVAHHYTPLLHLAIYNVSHEFGLFEAAARSTPRRGYTGMTPPVVDGLQQLVGGITLSIRRLFQLDLPMYNITEASPG